METSFFRKTSLERLSSPNNLNTITRITGAKKMAGAGRDISYPGCRGGLGYAGTIDTKVGGSGVIVRTGTVLNVVTAVQGW